MDIINRLYRRPVDCLPVYSAVMLDAAAEIERLRTETEDAKADALRLHRDKMAYYDLLLAIACSPTIHNVCGWYPEIVAAKAAVSGHQQTAPEKS